MDKTMFIKQQIRNKPVNKGNGKSPGNGYELDKYKMLLIIVQPVR
jgi:hypothetical protein